MRKQLIQHATGRYSLSRTYPNPKKRSSGSATSMTRMYGIFPSLGRRTPAIGKKKNAVSPAPLSTSREIPDNVTIHPFKEGPCHRFRAPMHMLHYNRQFWSCNSQHNTESKASSNRVNIQFTIPLSVGGTTVGDQSTYYFTGSGMRTALPCPAPPQKVHTYCRSPSPCDRSIDRSIDLGWALAFLTARLA